MGLQFMNSGFEERFPALFDDRTTSVPSSTLFPNTKGSNRFNTDVLPYLAEMLDTEVREIGPGPDGGFGAVAPLHGFNYIGIDTDPEAVDAASRAVPSATYLHDDPVRVIRDSPQGTSVISIRVLDLIYPGREGDRYREDLAEAIDAVAVGGTITYHFSTERSELPRWRFLQNLRERGWKDVEFPHTPFPSNIGEGYLLQKEGAR